MTGSPRQLIIGISGASGVVYGVRMLELLRETDVETRLMLSPSARMMPACETGLKIKDVRALAKVNYPNTDIGTSISSGPFQSVGVGATI